MSNATVDEVQGRGEVALRVAAWRRHAAAYNGDSYDDDERAIWNEADSVLFEAMCEARPTTNLEAAAQLEAVLVWSDGSLLSPQNYDVTAIRNVIAYLRRDPSKSGKADGAVATVKASAPAP